MGSTSSSCWRIWRGPLLAASAGLAAYLLSLILRTAPEFTERIYARWFGPSLLEPLSRISGIFPFAVGEWLVGLYLGGMALLGARGLRRGVRGQQRWRALCEGGVRRLLTHTGVIACAFYLLWGFNYARAPLAQRLGWPAWQGAAGDEVLRLATEAVDAANRSYVDLHGAEDAGTPTALPGEAAPLRAALDDGWQSAAARLHLGPQFQGRYGPPKRPLASGVMARLGIAGVFFPFTAEANVIRGLPAANAVHSMAHEQAHQRGVANEAEASFLGFVAGYGSGDPLARYSSALFATNQLLAALARGDREAFEAVNSRRLPGVRRDLADAAAFWDRYRGVGTRIGSAVNDRYLRANRVPGGIQSYALSVRLLIEYARQNGGTWSTQ